MDILTHGLTGLALSTTVAAHHKGTLRTKLLIGVAGLVGGVFPDIDVLSRAPGFDKTIGSWFELPQSGYDIFFDTKWYSHHVFTHSIIGALLFTILGSFIYINIRKIWTRQSKHNAFIYALAFLMGFMGHLFEDMITPGGPWNGIALFWPSANFSGGWGKIWWWNNYDLFLIIILLLGANIGFILFNYKSALLTKIGILVALILFIIQIERRDHDFNQKAQPNNESYSKQLQQNYLGKHIYRVMEKIDQRIPVPF